MSIIAVPPKTLTADQKSKLTKKGYVVIEIDDPDKVRIIVAEQPIATNDLLMSALHLVSTYPIQHSSGPSLRLGPILQAFGASIRGVAGFPPVIDRLPGPIGHADTLYRHVLPATLLFRGRCFRSWRRGYNQLLRHYIPRQTRKMCPSWHNAYAVSPLLYSVLVWSWVLGFCLF